MSAVIVERRGPTALLRLNQPESRNAMSPELRAGLERELPALLSDSAMRCLILTGTGDAFCAGGDLKRMLGRTAPEVRQHLQATQRWARLLLESDKPVIAAVNGAAVGAGFSLALLCDVVLVSDRAHFRAGFPAVGAAPDLGLAYTLPRAVGLSRAKEILLANGRIEPEEATLIGLASRVVAHEALIAEAEALAERIAAGPRTGLGLAKTLLNRAFASSFDQFLESEALAQAVAFGSPEFTEGVEAFIAKRPPDFSKY
jgi:2-(1,2-epoxy-1,2-dihydrophenyl)acetyl-CoA isomerase